MGGVKFGCKVRTFPCPMTVAQVRILHLGKGGPQPWQANINNISGEEIVATCFASTLPYQAGLPNIFYFSRVNLNNIVHQIS